MNSHYVPQFILRNFYKDRKITYCNIPDKTISLRIPRSVFSEEGYYPDAIERSLCLNAEKKFADLFHNKLEHAGHSIRISPDELFTIKKYLIISAVRYRFEETEHDKKISELIGHTFNIDYIDNLNKALACNNIDEMCAHLKPYYEAAENPFDFENTDDSALQLASEIKDIIHGYLIFVKSGTNEKFIIPDVGRGAYFGPLCQQKALLLIQYLFSSGDPLAKSILSLTGARDYTIYPLSQDLAVINMNVFYKLLSKKEYWHSLKLPAEYSTIESILGFGDRNLIGGADVSYNTGAKEYNFVLKRISVNDIAFLNMIMIAQAKTGIVCAGIESLKATLDKIEDYGGTEYSFMRDAL